MRFLLATLVMISTSAHAGTLPVIAGTGTSHATLDPIAEAYVHLTLEIGEHEPGYVDAYYGPDEWAKQATRSPRPLPELRCGGTTCLSNCPAWTRPIWRHWKCAGNACSPRS